MVLLLKYAIWCPRKEEQILFGNVITQCDYDRKHLESSQQQAVNEACVKTSVPALADLVIVYVLPHAQPLDWAVEGSTAATFSLWAKLVCNSTLNKVRLEACEFPSKEPTTAPHNPAGKVSSPVGEVHKTLPAMA